MGCIDALFNNPKEVILRATEEAKDPLGQMDCEASAIRPVSQMRELLLQQAEACIHFGSNAVSKQIQ